MTNRLLLTACLLGLSTPSWGAISRDGSCSGTTNCTVSTGASANGDLAIFYAYRNASTTAPSLPAGYTNIANSTAGTTNSYRIYCHVASGTGDASGTATNATGIVAVWYTGTAATTTAACATQGVALGVIAAANASAGTAATSVTYAGLTTSSGAGTSWIAGFMGDTVASDNCTPTGMSGIVTANQTTASDTNAAVASWASVSCTVTSATYRSYVLEILAASPACTSCVPTCSNIVDQTEPVDPNNSGAGYTQFYLPHATGVGNTIVAFATFTPGDTVTFTDDKSNTYFLGATRADATNGQNVSMFYASNVAASSHPQLRLTRSASEAFATGFAMECTNVATAAAIDVTTGNNAASNTITAGSATPLVTGDLVVQAYWNDYTLTPVTGITTSNQTNIPWNLMIADRVQNIGGQWGVYASTSALNPTMAQTSGTTGFNSVAIFLKGASAGTAFPTYGAGKSPVITAAKTFWSATSATYDTLPRTEQFPCAATNNSMVVEWLGGTGETLTSVSDSASNTWTQTAAAVCFGGGGGCAHAYYTQNATISPSQTITINGSATTASAKFYCISGGSTTAFFDKNASASGNQASAGNLNAVSITPSTSNGLVLGTISVALTTITGTTGSNQYFTGCFWSLQTGTGGGCDQNNGWTYYQNPNTTAVNFTWTDGAAAAGDWVGWADAFEGPASATSKWLPVIVR